MEQQLQRYDGQAVAGWSGDASMAALYMPVMQIAQVAQRYNAMVAFAQNVMKEDKDFGKIPGVDKPSLLKPGAEKLCTLFGLSPSFEVVREREEWTGEEPFFYYCYRCRLSRGGVVMGEGEGSCNSRESKYRYRWVTEDQVPEFLDKKQLVSKDGTRKYTEFDFAIDKAETTGKYGKPQEYWDAFKKAIEEGTAKRVEKETRNGKKPAWEVVTGARLFRVPNPDIADCVNTIQKMAQKRALVAATLIACNASDYFTQDVEDLEFVNGGAIIDVPTVAQVTEKVETAKAQVAEIRAAEAQKTNAKPPYQAQPEDLPGILGGTDTEPPRASALTIMLAGMTTKGKVREAFASLKANAVAVMGPSGETTYNRVLQSHGFVYGRGFETSEKAQACAKELFHLIENAKEALESDEPGPQPAVSLIEEVPEEGE